jgi:DNA-binding response OmpR family regulator
LGVGVGASYPRSRRGPTLEESLIGCVVLIAEDEPLIALEVKLGFEEEGARVIMAHTLSEALCGVEDPALSVAILDHGLGDGDSHEVCERMKERNIPFITYSGYHLDEDGREGVHVKKPASMSTLVATVRGLLAESNFKLRQYQKPRSLV